MNLGDQQEPAARTAEVNRAFAHIGLPAFDIVDTSVKNSRAYKPIPEGLRSKLVKFFAPHNRQLYKFLGRDLGWMER
jgi:hypothetical protein